MRPPGGAALCGPLGGAGGGTVREKSNGALGLRLTLGLRLGPLWAALDPTGRERVDLVSRGD
jgi:hypothetical protein